MKLKLFGFEVNGEVYEVEPTLVKLANYVPRGYHNFLPFRFWFGSHYYYLLEIETGYEVWVGDAAGWMQVRILRCLYDLWSPPT